jgi:ATP-binding cassette subfamily B protein
MVLGKHFYKYYFKYFYLFFIGISILIVIDYYQLDIVTNTSAILSALDKNLADFDYASHIITIIIIGVSITIGRVLWRLGFLIASRLIEHQIRIVMFRKALDLSQDFYSKEKVGNLMSYFINDLDTIRNAYGWGLLMLVDTLALGSFALYRMFKIDLYMTLWVILPIAFMMVCFYIFGKRIRSTFEVRQDAFSNLSDFTQETFSGITIVKAFVREENKQKRFEEQSEKLTNTHLKFVKQYVTIDVIINISITIAILIIMLYSTLSIYNGVGVSISLQDFNSYISYYFSLIWPALAISQFLNINNQSKASQKRISAFLDYPVSVKDFDASKDINNLTPDIEFKNLTYFYPDEPNKKVLDNVSFTIKNGERVGILGRTGSGKTTIVDLLLRVNNVDKGQLFIGGTDIMDIKIKEVRDLIGYVPQDNFLFSESITKNIGFSSNTIEDKVVVESSKLAGVYDNIVMFKEQFETTLGERGVTVSGGQKQRISIARALYKDPSILILDDSVSAVDTATEEDIINNLERIRKNRTTIFIAHRISTVKKMDKIILLDKGLLAGIGTHEELLKNNELYQSIYHLQALENIMENVDERL